LAGDIRSYLTIVRGICQPHPGKLPSFAHHETFHHERVTRP